MLDLYDCRHIPADLTVPLAHRIMQIHLHCRTRDCAPRRIALSVLRCEGRYRPEWRSDLG
jgi:hypothetical protein